MTPGVLRSQLLCSTCFIAFQGARAGLCQSRFFAQMSPGCEMGAPWSEVGMLEGETAVPTVLGENHPHPFSPMSPEDRCLEIPSAFPHIPPGSLNKRDSAWLYREHRGDEGRQHRQRGPHGVAAVLAVWTWSRRPQHVPCVPDKTLCAQRHSTNPSLASTSGWSVGKDTKT